MPAAVIAQLAHEAPKLKLGNSRKMKVVTLLLERGRATAVGERVSSCCWEEGEQLLLEKEGEQLLLERG